MWQHLWALCGASRFKNAAMEKRVEISRQGGGTATVECHPRRCDSFTERRTFQERGMIERRGTREWCVPHAAQNCTRWSRATVDD